MATNIGIMDAAYFVGRSEILSWINSTLQLNLSKVEEVLFSILFLHQIQSGLGLCLISDRWFLTGPSIFLHRYTFRLVPAPFIVSFSMPLIQGSCLCTRSISTPRASTRWFRTTRSFKMSSTNSKSPRYHSTSLSSFNFIPVIL